MPDSKVLRQHAHKLRQVMRSIREPNPAIDLLEVARDMERWADQIDGQRVRQEKAPPAASGA